MTGYHFSWRGLGDTSEQMAMTRVMLKTADPMTLLTLTSPWCYQSIIMLHNHSQISNLNEELKRNIHTTFSSVNFIHLYLNLSRLLRLFVLLLSIYEWSTRANPRNEKVKSSLLDWKLCNEWRSLGITFRLNCRILLNMQKHN